MQTEAHNRAAIMQTELPSRVVMTTKSEHGGPRHAGGDAGEDEGLETGDYPGHLNGLQNVSTAHSGDTATPAASESGKLANRSSGMGRLDIQNNSRALRRRSGGLVR